MEETIYRDYLVAITTTWLVRAESEEQAIEEFSDGNMLDRIEKAVLVDGGVNV